MSQPLKQAYVSVGEVATYMGLSQATVWRRINDGTIPYRQFKGPGHRVLVPVSALVQSGLNPIVPPVSTVSQTCGNSSVRRSCSSPPWKRKVHRL